MGVAIGVATRTNRHIVPVKCRICFQKYWVQAGDDRGPALCPFCGKVR